VERAPEEAQSACQFARSPPPCASRQLGIGNRCGRSAAVRVVDRPIGPSALDRAAAYATTDELFHSPARAARSVGAHAYARLSGTDVAHEQPPLSRRRAVHDRVRSNSASPSQYRAMATVPRRSSACCTLGLWAAHRAGARRVHAECVLVMSCRLVNPGRIRIGAQIPRAICAIEWVMYPLPGPRGTGSPVTLSARGSFGEMPSASRARCRLLAKQLRGEVGDVVDAPSPRSQGLRGRRGHGRDRHIFGMLAT